MRREEEANHSSGERQFPSNGQQQDDEWLPQRAQVRLRPSEPPGGEGEGVSAPRMSPRLLALSSLDNGGAE